MASIISILKLIQPKHPEITFIPGDRFAWSPSKNAIYYVDSQDKNDVSLLIHELAHGVLGHTNYTRDIELLQMERQAWEKAKEIGNSFDQPISDDYIEESLDSYREWLHKRGVCPKCQASGMQKTTDSYTCLACNAVWQVNDARGCELRRYLQN
jgi:hypothetical protein